AHGVKLDFEAYGRHHHQHSFPTRRSSDLYRQIIERLTRHFTDDLGAPTVEAARAAAEDEAEYTADLCESFSPEVWITVKRTSSRSEEHTSELQSRFDLVCRLLLEKNKASA